MVFAQLISFLVTYVTHGHQYRALQMKGKNERNISSQIFKIAIIASPQRAAVSERSLLIIPHIGMK